MNGLINIKTMSSLEIAALTGKEHSDVLRDIRKYIIGEKDAANLQHEQIQGVTIINDARNYTKEILLDKENSLVLVSGYSVDMRRRIIRRWLELEAKQTEPTPKPALTTEYDVALKGSEIIARMLNLGDVGKIKLVSAINNQYGIQGYLPPYGVENPDRAVETTVGNSEVTYALSVLLKANNVQSSAVKVNKVLVEQGFLETKTRPSASKATTLGLLPFCFS